MTTNRWSQGERPMTLCRGPSLASLAAGVLLAACQDQTGPEDSSRFDAARVQAGVNAVQRVAASPVLGSLQAVGRFAGDVGAPPVTGRQVAGHASMVRTMGLLADATLGAGTAMIPVIRSSVLGKTFVYDPAQRKYVPDGTRTGAPANGVRFILYEVNPETDEPIVGRVIGHADLLDEQRSSSTTAAIRLVVVSGGVTRLSYLFELTGSLQNAEFKVDGYLSDGTERLNFEITASQQLFGRDGQATVLASLSVPGQDFEVTARFRGTPGEENGDGEIDLTVRSRSDEIVVEAETAEGEIDATFKVNGQLLARATGDPSAPTIRGEGGRALTEGELQVLGEIVGMAEGVFKLVSDIVQPAGVLLLIALGIGG